MTAKKRDGDLAPSAKPETAAVVEAKGSVHEAIGKLIGDDAAEDHGSAVKRAGAAARQAGKKPSAP